MKFPQQLRIIGGQWRSRRLKFPGVPGLRPTPDRVRETLFNWLAPVIEGARCLDLFAGSGALGMEALSRGAASVVFVEQNPLAVKTLRENLELLKTRDAEVLTMDARGWLNQPNPKPFEIVFLDPPFSQDLLAPICQVLENNSWLKSSALIYLESETSLAARVPANWEILRDKTAGQVRYRLAQRTEIVHG